jgi:4-amino-4-deoxy-L-arabinose transferase-like glycosyltransferase
MSDHFSTIAKVGGFVLALILIFAGILMIRSDALTGGLTLLIAGLVIFLAAGYYLERMPLGDEHLAFIQPYRLLIICWISSLALVIWVIYQQTNSENQLYDLRWNGVLWLISIILLIVGAVSVGGWPQLTREKVQTWYGQNKREIMLVIALLAVGFILRVYALSLHPYPWSGDEASVGIDARRILQGEIHNLFATSWSSQPNLSFFPTTISLVILGETITAIRMVSAIVGTLTILTTYLLAREFFSKQVALLSAVFLVAFPYHLQFSRLGVSNIFDGLNVTLALWFVYRAITRNKLLDYVFAGIVTGLSFYTYVGSRLVLLLVLGSFIYATIKKRGYLRDNYAKIFGAFGFGTFITLAPMAAYFIKHPDNFMTRIGQEGILLNDWLANQAATTATSPFSILLDQFAKSTLVFISDSAIGNFFNSPDPFLTLLGSIFFLIGMASAFLKIKETRFVILLGWFWSVVLFGGILTTNPPASTRMVMSIPAIAIFIALGIEKIASTLQHLRLKPRLIQVCIGIVLGILFFQGIIFYFGEYWSGFYFRDGNSELGLEAGLQLRQLGTGYNYYLFGLPRVFAGFPTTIFLNPQNSKADLTSDDIESLVIPAEEGAFFVAIPENMADLVRIEERFPGGSWEVVERKTLPEVLYFAYILPPSEQDRP